MGQAPSGMRLKSISAIGSTRFPTKPTLNSRPPMYSWTSTSSNCSVMAARRARSDLRSLTTEPRSSPALASSAAGLTMAGSGKSSSILPCATVQRGMGIPACWSKAFATGLRRHAARVQRLAPVMGIPANSSVPTTCSSHSLFPWTPSQVEHEIRPARHLEPAHVVADADLADLVAHRGEDRADLVHGFHYAADVLGCPVFGAWVEQDDDLHAPTTARCWAGVARRVPASTVSSCPVSRRQAIRTTSWISSS